MDDGQPGGTRPLIADVRRQGIIEMLNAEGSVTVASIEQRFGVSSMTARRDLADLERRGIARRTHGGAVLPTSASHEDSFTSRMQRSPAAKQRLASAAAQLVGDEESVLLDSSSTAFHVAAALLERNVKATVITNSQPIMDLVGSHPSPTLDLIGIGGSLRRLTRSFVGPVATAAVQAHYADRMFFSVKGLTRDGALTDADPLEAEVKRSMLEHAAESVLLVDHSKLESRGLAVIAHVSDVNRVMTCGVDEQELAPLIALGMRVQAVAPDGEAVA